MGEHETAVLTAIQERRSIRRYTNAPINSEILAGVLDAGRFAPSGLNNQPWRFLVLRDGDPRQAALAECTKYAHIVRGATALIAVFLDKEKTYHPLKDHQAVGACIQNMLLAAHALGLGAVWLGEIVNQAPQLLRVLGIDPEHYEAMALLSLGYPAEKGSSSRLPLSELLLEAL